MTFLRAMTALVAMVLLVACAGSARESNAPPPARRVAPAPVAAPVAAPAPARAPIAVRVAQFNVEELSREKLLEVDADGNGAHEQLVAAAAIIQRFRPDVLVLNEIDFDHDAWEQHGDTLVNLRLFHDNYLARGENPLVYPHLFAAPSNTGILTGIDLNNDGIVATETHRGTRVHGEDSFGFGTYPGHYAMGVLSRHPFDEAATRTFQNFLWSDLPGNLMPRDWYSAEAAALLRLSSKSHWDLPVVLPNGARVHLLVSHPTPPVFDGPEDRNGRRNVDEIRFWAAYIDNAAFVVDDAGARGGLAPGASFLVAGDLNASPRNEPDYFGKRAIDHLLDHPRIADTGALLTSCGGLAARAPGAPDWFEQATARFGGHHRVDYLLPSANLTATAGGVYWPCADDDPSGAALADKASDHRFIWLDVEVE